MELYGDVEMRTRDALDEIDRWGFDVGASVRLLPFLKAFFICPHPSPFMPDMLQWTLFMFAQPPFTEFYLQ